MMFIDTLVIPANAPNPEFAHQFLNYLMQPEVAARITNATHYPNANADAAPFLDEQLRDLNGITLDKETRRRLSLFPTLLGSINTQVDAQWAAFREPPATH